MGQFLSRHDGDPTGPPPAGLAQLRTARARTPALVALAQEAIPNEGDAWNLTLDEIELYFDRVLAQRLASPPAGPPASLVEAARMGPPPALQELVGRYFSLARQLGQRTADVHLVLAGGARRSGVRRSSRSAPSTSSRSSSGLTCAWCACSSQLRRRLGQLPPQTRELAAALIPQEHTLDDRLRRVVGRKIEVSRIRCHGDLHLGQVLFTGDDFVIIDFEGEPARPTVERRYKRCALRDAMGMFRSFSYVTEAVLRSGRVRPEDLAPLAPWAEAWTDWVGAVYLGAYLQAIAGTHLGPRSDELTDLLLEFYELEKVIYEVEYELNNRPDWLHIPLAGMSRILQRRK